MPVTVLIGAQWGDEGKGRVADWLAEQSDAMARYAGGDNAGHTVRVGVRRFGLHLVPSGIIHPHLTCILGSGMVINPLRLVGEMDMLAGQNIDISPERIHISPRAHVITPAHTALDGASERALGEGSIGTTQRGIGPAYSAKAERTGILTGMMADPAAFVDAVREQIEQANRMLVRLYGLDPIEVDAPVDDYYAAAERLAPYLHNTTQIVHELLDADKRLLCEGAQGTLLDIDQGHYPFVTSSSATVGGALTGLGFGPHVIDRVVAVAKAYCTRVGNGPFPTELDDAMGQRLREVGSEYGTTTGRPRRCGWLDAIALRYAVKVNGVTDLVLTKLDVLSGLDTLHIATAYDTAQERVTSLPLDTATAESVTPVYEALPGWHTDISRVRRFKDLPANAQRYVERIEALVGAPVSVVSVGPEREQAIVR
ncbi:adenylosuccinate synthase [Aggregatilinea lenta]|uniref:adenylosuccinate synthase n=1 Tax=Aggregatilinea lenta TaxID=913108 RepID=UPI000E5B32B6|nr:adenylosuccinate synthase [Aggregatilinea lenta]